MSWPRLSSIVQLPVGVASPVLTCPVLTCPVLTCPVLTGVVYICRAPGASGARRGRRTENMGCR